MLIIINILSVFAKKITKVAISMSGYLIILVLQRHQKSQDWSSVGILVYSYMFDTLLEGHLFPICIFGYIL